MSTGFKVGKTYDIDHSRKGCLTVKILSLNDEWANSELISGRAKMMTQGAPQAGETLTFRIELVRIIREVTAEGGDA
ncbi:hypothetical protein GCM10010873_26890 [Cypionkella aquatica]|uniref:Uncharacterized protein n=1 Tax=Cypionkella aquatica TaxID=1756042 RepID=A0AA37U6G9_9RHOB|nr:hypothetical protein [Cypionkella aquatica]GLS87715.1 hypothetical protein GCM10010873_26890 [Cypionkella aquatica]